MRMKGYNVLFPMGFDAFGLPAENAAVQANIHPWRWTYANIERMRRQLRSMGTMIDWDREAVSCTPEYYRWTEWFFSRLYEAGLAYRGEALVNWSPTLQTVLANEQVIDGRDERTGQPVVQRMMEQWFFRITRYAEELLDFGGLDWPEPIKAMQTNWIGRSVGARVRFPVEGADPIEVFTTRPDTLHGATFMVLALRSIRWWSLLTTPEQSGCGRGPTGDVRGSVAPKCSADRPHQGEERGVHRWDTRLNPVTGERHPGLDRRLRTDELRHRGDHGRAGRGRAATGSSPSALRAARSSVRCGPPKDFEGKAYEG